jgi:hypothetical protein
VLSLTKILLETTTPADASAFTACVGGSPDRSILRRHHAALPHDQQPFRQHLNVDEVCVPQPAARISLLVDKWGMLRHPALTNMGSPLLVPDLADLIQPQGPPQRTLCFDSVFPERQIVSWWRLEFPIIMPLPLLSTLLRIRGLGYGDVRNLLTLRGWRFIGLEGGT